MNKTKSANINQQMKAPPSPSPPLSPPLDAVQLSQITEAVNDHKKASVTLSVTEYCWEM